MTVQKKYMIIQKKIVCDAAFLLNNSVDKRIEQITSFHFISENRVSDNSKKIGILPWTSSYPNSTVFVNLKLKILYREVGNLLKHYTKLLF